MDTIQETVSLILAEAANLHASDTPSVKHLCGLVVALTSQVGELCAYVATATAGASAAVSVDSGDSAGGSGAGGQ